MHCNWVDLSKYDEQCTEYANEVDSLKLGFVSSSYRNPSPHRIGKLGECIFGELFNLPVNFDLHYQGDNGIDFKLNGWIVDVKSTVYWKHPDLKEFPNLAHVPDVYVLAAIDPERMRGRLVGFCSALRLLSMPPTDYKGLGRRYWVSGDALCKDWLILDNHSMKYAKVA
jgi:hypothetical protein